MAPGLTGKAGAIIFQPSCSLDTKGVLIGTGFDGDDGASLLMAFRGLQAESAAQGRVHNNIAKELITLVADPFEDWALEYKVASAQFGEI